MALYLMLLSPVVTDTQLFKIIADGPVRSARSIFEMDGWNGEYNNLVDLLGHYIKCPHNFKEAHYCIDAALLCSLDKDVLRNPAGMLALKGVGLKILFETQEGAFGNCIGIGVDAHMLRIFHALEWTKALENHDNASAELMQWFPRERWREMNKTYAGLGQLLQSDVKHEVAKRIREKAQILKEPYQQMADKILLLKEYNV
jgi:hypothetical protein